MTIKLCLKVWNHQDPTEAQEICDLIATHYPKTAYPLTVDSLCEQHNKVFFKAFVGEEWVGMSGYEAKTPTLVESIKTIVLESARGKGYGRLISQAIEDECVRRGFKKVMTTIYAHNTAMISIKLKQGYTIEGYHPDHEAPGFHEYSLGKVLLR